MSHIREFSRFATSYQRYKIIQSKVASYLVEKTPFQGKNILDLGAGSGEVYRNIFWKFDTFYAVDASWKMLELHPPCTQKILCDFDDRKCFEPLQKLPIDQIFAASSLQWSRDLDGLFYHISRLSEHVAFAIFTSNTFRTIHRLANIQSPIYDKYTIIECAKKYFSLIYEVREYKLFFPDKKELFSYIKRSGVSKGERKLGFRQTKKLICEYPYNYIEFEVVFLWSKK